MPMGIVVISCVRPSVQPSMGLGLCIAYKALGRNGLQFGMLMYPDGLHRGGGTPYVMGDTYVPRFWPPFFTLAGSSTIFLGYFFSSTNTKTIFWGIKTTNSYRIRSFRPQISFFPRSFWVQFSAASGTPPSFFGPSTPPGAYTQHSWMLMDIVVGLSVRPSVRLFVYGIFRWLCICWQITWNKWHKIWHDDVVIIGRWLLPSLVDTGDICCHYWQLILVFYWHIFHSSGFHHICNIKCRLDCRYSP